MLLQKEITYFSQQHSIDLKSDVTLFRVTHDANEQKITLAINAPH